MNLKQSEKTNRTIEKLVTFRTILSTHTTLSMKQFLTDEHITTKTSSSFAKVDIM